MIPTTLIKSGKIYYKITGVTKKLYKKYPTEESTEYDPKIILHDDEAYTVSKFTNKSYCPDILKRTFNATDYDEFSIKMEKNSLVNIVNNIYFFQRITQSMIKPKKHLKLFDKRAEYKFTSTGKTISIENVPDAFYDKNENKLYFLKFNNIKKLFPGIEELYRSATDDEVTEFLNQDFIKAANKLKVGEINRKRIALLKDKYNSLSQIQKERIKDYIHNYYAKNVILKDGKFEISSNKDLTKLLYGLDERYYTMEISKENRIANSVIKIS